MIVVLLVASGAAWESTALRALNEHPGTVLLKRCVDVADLLASASTGQASVAVVGLDLAGLDRRVVEDLARSGVRVVGVSNDPATTPRAAHGAITSVLGVDRISDLATMLANLPAETTMPAHADGPAAPTLPGATPAGASPAPGGRVIAVWGPGGAPGRTMLASALAGEMARRGLGTLLIDADPYGGAIAQQLGILDEVSGLLAAARLSAAGTLTDRFATVTRRLSDHLTVVTGLPRPDRWIEVRPGVLEEIIDVARQHRQLVIDTGFSVETDLAGDLGRPERNGLTRQALAAADDVVLVGGADPVGLARLARSLTEFRESYEGKRVRVVVNRMRPSLGWRESDVVEMLAGFGADRVHFLPDDQETVDRAMVAGRLLIESGDSPLTRAVGALLDVMAASATPLRR